MRGPTGMGNTHSTAHILVVAVLTQVIHLTLGLIHIQFTVGIDQGHSSRVIATILQTAKPLYQNGESLLITYISYYSTHSLFIFCVKGLSGIIRLENLHALLQLVVLMVLNKRGTHAQALLF